MIFSWTSFKKDSFYFLENGKKIIIHPSVFLPIRYLKLWSKRKNLNIKDPLLPSLEITKENAKLIKDFEKQSQNISTSIYFCNITKQFVKF